MLRTCDEPNCAIPYDDADRSTICPHDLIKSPEDSERHRVAFSLLHKPLRFRNQPWVLSGAKPLYIQTIYFNGTISFHDHTGEYLPDLFEVIP
jgi:hypothetical protein